MHEQCPFGGGIPKADNSQRWAIVTQPGQPERVISGSATSQNIQKVLSAPNAIVRYGCQLCLKDITYFTQNSPIRRLPNCSFENSNRPRRTSSKK